MTMPVEPPQPPYQGQGPYQMPVGINQPVAPTKKKLPKVAIVGIVVGSVFALCCIGGVIAAVASPSGRQGFKQGYEQGQKAAAATSSTAPASSPTTPAASPTKAAAPVTQSPTAVATKAAPPPPPPTTAAAHQPAIVLSARGNGIKKTQIFTTGDEWELSYTFDCKAAGGTGNFQVFEYDSSGNMGDILTNELSAGGSDTVPQHADGGQHYLEVNSECSWTITVKS